MTRRHDEQVGSVQPRRRRVVDPVRRHPLRITGIATVTLFVAGLAWIVVTGLLGLRAAHQAQSELGELRLRVASGDSQALDAYASRLAVTTAAAHTYTTGPAWWLAAHIPLIGAPAAEVRAATGAAHTVGARVLPELTRAGQALDPRALRSDGHTIRLAPLVAARPAIDRAAAAARDAARDLNDAPTTSWLSSIDSRVARTRSEVAALARSLNSVELAARVLPPLAGADGPRRYFVGLQNESELRGTGGLPGVFAILVADHGSLRFTRFASDSAIDDGEGPGIASTGLSFGADFQRAYGAAEPNRVFVNSNISPDFPTVARIWASMWERVSHERVDGAIAVDPTALSYLLQVTGPTTLASGETVSASDIVDLTERDAYVRHPSATRRKQFLVSLVKSVDTDVLSGAGNPTALLQALGHAVREGRLTVWSNRPAEESVLRRSALSGALPPTHTPLIALVVTNVAGTKLDYYLQRSLSVQRLGCGKARQVRVAITLDNGAPRSGLPNYVWHRLDSNAKHSRPGDNRVWVDYLASDGARLLSATLDGRPTVMQALHVFGHPDLRTDLELPAGRTRTIVLQLLEPSGGIGAPVVLRQPGVRRTAIDVVDQCGADGHG